ncbi:MAG: hypothetical protein A2751_05960 [Candidatus Doudnabacteria bacterium RIFCSPHIGHO2_01_FULL_46_14]|uniref:Fibronectin type-III domain-containing protein n=1 Tax=Candidatus Doudnabacteria bacterium RIFCSPHIGHO2_01_FULL_46_14 TaxID=1817824 RepID=A0A1F5NNQ3_9BACT|nr:MAG: hypothetical protein A2751_05960 [Candidatus Doudnabacteria bacterium RIFCSPHIGHO2_01_FULL_46_14]
MVVLAGLLLMVASLGINAFSVSAAGVLTRTTTGKLFFDDFNRASIGSNYLAEGGGTGNWSIVGNRVRYQSAGSGQAVLRNTIANILPNAVYEGTFNVSSWAGFVTPRLRAQVNGNDFYYFDSHFNQVASLFKNSTNFFEVAQNYNSNTDYRVKMKVGDSAPSGSKLWLNETLLGAGTDSVPLSAGNPALWVADFTSGNSIYFDNLSVYSSTDLTVNGSYGSWALYKNDGTTMVGACNTSSAVDYAQLTSFPVDYVNGSGAQIKVFPVGVTNCSGSADASFVGTPGNEIFGGDIFTYSENIADTTAPIRSNGAPSGTLASGTTQTTLSLSTDENAICRYSTVADIAYSAMTDTFSTTGATSHSTTVSGLANGQSYTYYIRCEDTAGNANPNDYSISFSVSELLPDGPLTRYSGNPIVRNGPEAYDFMKAGPRVVLKEGPTNYRMWYEALDGNGVVTVAYATSVDGLNWTKQGIQIFPTLSWESEEVSPNYMIVEDGIYKLYYHAGGMVSGGTRIGGARVGLATSFDGGFTWTKNLTPVLVEGPSGAFDDEQVAEPRITKIGNEYRMYYTGRNLSSGLNSLGMATSSDGINWTKYANNPVIGTAEWGNFWGGAFFFNGTTWHLWHAKVPYGLHYKSSTDGITWTNGSNNPVLTVVSDPNSPDSFVGDSISGYLDGSTYRIMYSGFSSNLFGSEGRFEGINLAYITPGSPPPPTNVAPSVNAGTDQNIILPASANLDGTVSDDGLPNPPASVTTVWSQVSGPGIATFGNANAVDTTAVFSASGVYVLRLTASDSVLAAQDDIVITVDTPPGPSDALVRYSSNPIMKNDRLVNPNDSIKTGPKVIFKEGPSAYKMWYEAVPSGNQSTAGYATSPDGVNWTKVQEVMVPSEIWEGGATGESSPTAMLFENRIYKMWYHGDAAGNIRRIGYATSSDGIVWNKYVSNPVLDLGSSGAWDDGTIAEPRIIKVGSEYWLFYAGKRTPSSGSWSLGLATSADGINFTKHPANPILTNTLGAGYAIIFDEGMWHLWVEGDTQNQIKYYSSSNGINWTEGANNPVLTRDTTAGSPEESGAGDSLYAYRDNDKYIVTYGCFSLNGTYPGVTDGNLRGICRASVNAPADTTSPSVSFSNPGTGAIVSGSVTLSAYASDAAGIQSVSFDYDGNNIGVATVGQEFSVSWNTASVPDGTYNITATATDVAGNTATSSISLTVDNSFVDTVSPSIPTNLSATAISTSQINLSWIASTDNVGVTGYKVFRDSVQIATITSTSYSDTGLTASTTYIYTVSAFDAAGNESSQSATATATTQSPPPPPGPIAAYSFNAGAGSTLADASGNNRNGTLVNGPAWTTGQTSNALNFDGTDDYVAISDFAPPTSLTLEAWIYPGNNGNNDSIILNKNNSEYDFRLFGVSGELAAGAGGVYISDPSFNFYDPANANQWYHVVYTFDTVTDTHKLYRNGVLVASGINTAAISNTSNALWIGRHSQWNFGTFLGKIDNVRIYDRVLSETEIQFDMNTPVAP